MALSTADVLLPVRHAGIFFLTEIKRLTAYRVQFWCELVLSSLVELLVALTVWRAVFEAGGAGVIAGYSFRQMVLYVTTAVFFGQAVRGTGVGTLAWEIYDGALTKFLIYPLSILSYKFGIYLPRAVFALAQLALALGLLTALGFWPAGTTITLENLALTGAALLLACALYFLLLFAVECGAFWADNVWALSVMLQMAVTLLSGKWIPLEFFPARLAAALELSPFPYLAFFPIKLFLGELGPAEIIRGFGVLLFWTAAAALASRAVFRRGLRSYTGVGI